MSTSLQVAMKTTFNSLPYAMDTAKQAYPAPESTPELLKHRYCRSGFCMSVMTDPRSTHCDDCLLQTRKKRSPIPNQLQVLYWTLSEGELDTTITVIMEQTVSESPRGPLKIVFGQLQVDTFYCAHLIPLKDHCYEDYADGTVPCLTGSAKMNATTLITLTAKVPDVRKIQLGHQGQVSIFVYGYNYYKHDQVIGFWTVGDFTHHDGLLQQQALPSKIPIRKSQKKKSSVEQLLRSFDDVSSESTLSAALKLQNVEIEAWIKQQAQLLPLNDRESQQFCNDGNLRNGSSQGNATTDLINNLTAQGNQQVEQYDTTGLINWLDISGSSSDFDTPYEDHFMESTRSNNSNSSTISTHIGTGDASSYAFDASLSHPINARRESNDLTCIHPFAGILNKANLKICGDLMEMTFNWSANERHSGRRLIRFWRHQTMGNMDSNQQVECGFEPIEFYHQQHQQTQQSQHHIHMDNTLSASSASSSSSNISSVESGRFSSLPSHDAPPLSSPTSLCDTSARLWDSDFALSPSTTADSPSSSHVVSCIYWKEHNDFYITSVDCLYLLESLIGVQFTVEEKNRIRRNLEGFRPLTVSKCREDSADFFKMIMDFPHPRPRNIEKDIKVFSWRLLPHALRKIIRKYTPNYNRLRKTPSSYGMPSPQVSPSTVYHHPFSSPYQLPSTHRYSY